MFPVLYSRSLLIIDFTYASVYTSVPIPQFCLILRISELNLMKISTFLSESKSHSVMLDSLRPHGFYSQSNSPGQYIGTVAFPFSRVSSQPRDWTQISHIAGGFSTSWTTREALLYVRCMYVPVWIYSQENFLKEVFMRYKISESVLNTCFWLTVGWIQITS